MIKLLLFILFTTEYMCLEIRDKRQDKIISRRFLDIILSCLLSILDSSYANPRNLQRFINFNMLKIPHILYLKKRDGSIASQPLPRHSTRNSRLSLTRLPYHISAECMYFRVACPETLSQVSQTRHESRPGTFTAKELFDVCQAYTNTSP